MSHNNNNVLIELKTVVADLIDRSNYSMMLLLLETEVQEKVYASSNLDIRDFHKRLLSHSIAIKNIDYQCADDGVCFSIYRFTRDGEFVDVKFSGSWFPDTGPEFEEWAFMEMQIK